MKCRDEHHDNCSEDGEHGKRDLPIEVMTNFDFSQSVMQKSKYNELEMQQVTQQYTQHVKSQRKQQVPCQT